MLLYPAVLPLSSTTLNYTAGVIRRHRQAIGSPWRRPDRFQHQPGVSESVGSTEETALATGKADDRAAVGREAQVALETWDHESLIDTARVEERQPKRACLRGFPLARLSHTTEPTTAHPPPGRYALIEPTRVGNQCKAGRIAAWHVPRDYGCSPGVRRQVSADQLAAGRSLTKVPRPCMVTIKPRSRRISIDLRIVL